MKNKLPALMSGLACSAIWTNLAAGNIVVPPPAVPGGNNPGGSTIVVATPGGSRTEAVQPQRNGTVITPATFRYHRPPGSNLGKDVVSPPPKVRDLSGSEVRAGVLDNVTGLQLTPGQINTIKNLQLEKDRARAMPYTEAADPVTRTLPLDLAPGKTPPVLRLSQGIPTAVVFSDSGGQPWIIEKVTLNRSLFTDGRDGGAGNGLGGGGEAAPTNVLTLEPLSAAPYGSVAVMLKGMPTPVIFMLTTAQKKVDVRVDVKVPGHNPDRPAAVSYQSSPQRDESLGYFLDGVPPEGAKRLKTDRGTDVEAWTYNGETYVRTSADVLRPAYLHSAKSTTGLGIYRFPGKPSSVTLVSGGRSFTVFIE